MITDLQGADAFLFERNDGLTEEQKKVAQTWTYFDEDLEGVDPAIAADVLQHRTNFAHNDLPRYAFKREIPDDVVLYGDIPYLPDATRGHLLDVLLPRDAVVRGGAAVPVIFEVHGGAYFYGFKEINRSHAIELARHGYAVVSASYPLYPAVDFLTQLRDLASALEWVSKSSGRYLLDTNQVFFTGDSAGVTLVLHLTAAMNNDEYASLLDVHPAKLGLRALGLKSAMADLDRLFDENAYDAGGLVEELAPCFTRYVERVKGTKFERLAQLVVNAGLPPVWMATSTDDFLEATSLELGVELRKLGIDHELLDYRAAPRECLPHNYIVGMPWLKETREAVESMLSFFAEHMAPRMSLNASE